MQPTQPPPHVQQHTPSRNELNKIIQTYFLKKGYSPSDLASFQQSSEYNLLSLEQLIKKLNDSPTNTSNGTAKLDALPDYIKLIKQESESGGDLDATEQSFEKLREWILNALDLYRNELRSVLYPIFVHVFLDLISKGLVDHALDLFQKYKHDHIEHHTKDLDSLSQIKSPAHVKNNATSALYLHNKYNIRMSSIPYELLLSYMQDNKFITLLRFVNQYLHIHIVTGKLTPTSTGGSSEQGEEVAAEVVEEGIVGHVNDQIEEFHDINSVQLEREEDTEMDGVDVNKVKQENLIDTMNLDEMAAIPYRGTDIQAELDSLSDLRKRVSLGSTALPSVCIYTFHNTHDQLNCLSISEDTSLVAGGFSESFIKVWSLKGKLLQSTLEKEQDQPGTKCKKLIGHAGPVYGVSFSHDNQYLISCSEDQTVRLWSMDTFKNLVCYKSHNYPIWDVDFGPYGFYFATASHDRTARLWSCDHINPLRIFAGHLSDVNAVKFHPNSKYIVTGSSDKTARLWDVQRGTCVRVFTGHTGSVHTVAVSPNGRLMASAGEDKSIILWDLGTGKKLKSMTGHTGFIYSVSFNSESTVLVSGGADGTVRVWDVLKDTPHDVQVMDSPDAKRAKTVNGSTVTMNGKQKETKKETAEKAAAAAATAVATATDSSSNKRKKGTLESIDHLSVFPTKNTPIYIVQFTQRNLCLAAGAMSPPSLDL